MTDSYIRRASNLVGAFALGIADAQREAVEHAAGQAGAGPAALVALGKYPGESVTFFAPLLGLTSSGAVRLFERLRADGLVERSPGADARTVALRLTSRGRKAADRVRAARRHSIEHGLAPLSPLELDQLAALLEKALGTPPADRTAARRLCRLCDHANCDEAGTCPVDLAATAAGHPSYEDDRSPGT